MLVTTNAMKHATFKVEHEQSLKILVALDPSGILIGSVCL